MMMTKHDAIRHNNIIIALVSGPRNQATNNATNATNKQTQTTINAIKQTNATKCKKRKSINQTQFFNRAYRIFLLRAMNVFRYKRDVVLSSRILWTQRLTREGRHTLDVIDKLLLLALRQSPAAPDVSRRAGWRGERKKASHRVIVPSVTGKVLAVDWIAVAKVFAIFSTKRNTQKFQYQMCMYSIRRFRPYNKLQLVVLNSAAGSSPGGAVER